MSLLTRPLNIYNLPPELLSNLAVRTIAELDDTSRTEAGPSKSAGHTKPPLTQAPAGSLSCQSCPNAAFESVEEQRAHFKSDWHRYNAKARIEGKKVVDAEQWDNMVEGVSSISGSASSSSSSNGSSDSDKVTKLLKKQNLHDRKRDGMDGDSDEEAELAHNRRRAMLRTAIIWFTPSRPLPEFGIPQDTQFGMHRFLFPPLENVQDYLGELKRMQVSNGMRVDEVGQDEEERRITLLMVAGGHFAGMVVGLKPKAKNEKQDIKGAGEVRVIKSKTFHRYTTRKKQGGSQGLNDNSKSKAISAGAMLRRYGETALQEEIRSLLADWEDDLAMSEKIFLRASTHGKRSFWGYEGAVLHKSDERIRVFPFPTRRPTIAELLRCWHELTRVKISHLTADALQAQDEAYIASLQPKRPVVKPQPASAAPAPSPAPAQPRLSPEEEAKLDRQKRLVDMVKKGRLDSLRPFVAKYPDEITSSVLATAAAAGQEEILLYLLEEVKLDPTVSVDGRKPYDHSSTKGIRNVFRRLAFREPEMWDWAAAHVPSGLSEEKEKEEERRKAERRKGLRDKAKERERARAEAAAEEEARNPAPLPPVLEAAPTPSMAGNGPPGSQKLGGRMGGEGNLAGMTPEMRMRVERERRARAAEARFKQ